MRRGGLTLIAISIFASALPLVLKAADPQGEVHLYLQPFPFEASKLTVAVDGISALDSSGISHPLKLQLKFLRAEDLRRQRALASGSLPSGRYSGFALRVSKGTLKGDSGESALLLPDAPVKIDFPFTLERRQATVFHLIFRYKESLSSGFQFTPVFSIVIPNKPLAARAGFISDTDANAITVFDKRARQAVAQIPTCESPAGMVLDQGRLRLYVACPKESEIEAIDVTAAEVVERTRLFPGDGPRELALTPDGRTLLSVNRESNSVTFVDAVSLLPRDRVDVGSGPNSIVIDQSGRRAFVFNTLSSSISVLDVLSRNVVGKITTDSAPLRGEFNGRGDRLYVIHQRSPYLTVIDTQQLTVASRTRVKMGLTAMRFDARRNLVYIGGEDERMVEFYDPAALVPVDFIRTPGGISQMTIDGEENLLYMVSPDTKTLVIGNLSDRKVVTEIDVGESPYWVVVMGER